MNIFRRSITTAFVDRLIVYKVLVLIVTFFIYMSYHLSRRSLSVVKPVLNHKNCSDVGPQPINDTDEHWCDWEPFKGPHARSILGTLDLVFLLSYSCFMYVNGYIAERCNLRYFLAIGMIFAGLCNVLFGAAYYFNIHSLGYFYGVQVITGMAQSTGWPGVLATVGHWFGPEKRGLIFGIWNAHINVGNIAGAAVAGAFVDTNWGLSFIVPAIIIASVGVIVFFVLVPTPEEANINTKISLNNELNASNGDMSGDGNPITQSGTNSKAISIIEAIRIPGVIEFSICLFFAKLVSYTFLDWLPYYISQTNAHITPQKSAFLTISFDMGGIVGGISAGYLADRSGASALTCIFMLIFAIPSLYLYYLFGNDSDFLNEFLQFIAGIFVNAPYALITTAVSAELGTKVPSKSALATVSGIIDATGSLGSAIGPSLAGLVSEHGWDYVFLMVMLSDLCALISILRIGYKDASRLWTTFFKRK